ncbi:DnaJ C-terminal domain-containing protein [Dactylosporangium sucinum]|uniref:Chaperone protein DnaJ 2 n=1 Tax=Dactylosporangium sucinum TaxID=1424081 RepID=A0A917WWV6_9ACTN|nr:DnaJ C-terminal domain-containing protein [Dactylosporangium sucinum]GGM40376.1 chaperone protein DnaJ 2 [Dactylosporangium sucinum]
MAPTDTAVDYYRVLGVNRDAPQDEIQRAYRKLARRSHPDVDRSPGAEDRFKQITEAYHVLSDPERRRKYDQFGSDWRHVTDEAMRTPRPGNVGAARDVDLDDLFASLFGGHRPGRGGPVAGADTEAELDLSIEDAFRGGRRRVTLPGRALDVTIPAGVVDGQRIRLAGQGSSGTPPGDLYLVVRLEPHPRYRVQGRDLVADLAVAPWDAALGASVPMGTPAGQVRVTVPPGTSSGRRLRLAGQGLPNPRGAPGDLYAVVSVTVPRPATDEERTLWRRLAELHAK